MSMRTRRNVYTYFQEVWTTLKIGIDDVMAAILDFFFRKQKQHKDPTILDKLQFRRETRFTYDVITAILKIVGHQKQEAHES